MALTDVVHYNVTNLMIPAFGSVRCLKANFPNGTNNEIEMNTILIEDVPFNAQSVTVDASALDADNEVIFYIKQIDFTKRVQGGNTVTFNFPAIPNMIISVNTSYGILPVKCFFYNFPSFTDFQGTQQVEIVTGGGTTLDVNLVSADPAAVVSAKLSDIDELTRTTTPLFIKTTLSVAGNIGGNVLLAPAGVGFRYVVFASNVSFNDLVVTSVGIIRLKATISGIEMSGIAKGSLAAQTGTSTYDFTNYVILEENEGVNFDTTPVIPFTSGSVSGTLTYYRVPV